MAVGFQDLLQDLFDPIGGVSFERMFGGVGVFRQGMMFALVAEDTLYLKADETTRPAHEAEGCGPFDYESKRGTVSTSYWRLPERLYDEPEAFRDWALAAFGVAERAQKKKPQKRKRKTWPAAES